MQPVVVSHTFGTSLSEEEARQRVAAVLAADPWAKPLADSDTFRSGSRFSFRMWGLWGPGARQRLPALWSVATAPSALILELRSDEGAYLVRPPLVDDAYRRAFDHVAVRVERALAS